jgi:hypothetical protein
MAEIVGLIAAAPACIKLADYCLKFSTELYQLSQGLESILPEIEHYRNQVENFSTTVRMARNAIINHHRLCPQSVVFRMLDTGGCFENILSQSNFAHTLLGDLMRRLMTNARLNLVRYIKWRFHKPAAFELLLYLDHIKGTLQFIMQAASLEETQSALEMSKTKREFTAVSELENEL